MSLSSPCDRSEPTTTRNHGRVYINYSFANILHFVCYFFRKRVKQQIPDRETPALTEKSPHFGERFIQMQLRARELRLYDRPSKLKFWLFGSSTCTCSNCNMSSRFITWSAFCIHLSLVIY